MKSVELRGVTKRLHGEVILENINLVIPSGKFFALLGPSGCGKTTLLRLIGGFELVNEGQIFIGDRDITQLPSNQRSVNTVFQNYALFPHLSVFDNIAYSLNVRNVDKSVVRKRVGKIAEAFSIDRHLYKEIGQLSGGQQQRVAIARAVINEPDVLLLDEPLAALDSKLRERLLVELSDVQEMLQTTFVYVTHDPFEALTVADQVAIMNNDGDIEQMGTPREIYEFPVSSFAARFVGTTNILKGTFGVREAGFGVDVPDVCFFLVDQAGALVPNAREGLQAFVSIRPEKITISRRLLEGVGAPKLTGRVANKVYYGHSTMYQVQVNDGIALRVFEQNEEHVRQEEIDYDDQVYLYWLDKNVVVLER